MGRLCAAGDRDATRLVDSRESTLPSRSQTTAPAVDRPESASHSGPVPDSGVAEAQKALRAAASELQAVDQRLSGVAERLAVLGSTTAPPGGSRGAGRGATNGFVILAELRGAIDCVRADLLADAIMTLDAAGTMTEDELRRRCAERRRVLVL